MSAKAESSGFNVQHAPVGAYASLTLGHPGTRGGLAIELGRPGDQNVFIGWKSPEGPPQLLPFFVPAENDRSAFEVDANLRPTSLDPIDLADVTRELGPAHDVWRFGPCTLELYAPRPEIPDPERASEEALRLACCPAIVARLILDNTNGLAPLTAIFALQDEAPFRDLAGDGSALLRGVGLRDAIAIAARPQDNVWAVADFGIEDLFGARLCRRLGKVGGLLLEAPPGQRASLTFAVAVFRGGVVTTGLPARYYYTRHFTSVEQVLGFALDHADHYVAHALRARDALEREISEPARRFVACQAEQSYYGSTVWLDLGGRSQWVVVEGEYGMMNTLDLTVDHAFFELSRHPWTLRSALDLFAERYAYTDAVRTTAPAAAALSFCHDQGVGMQWSPAGHSAYEQPDIPGQCFSYMSYEELTNFILCLALYCNRTGDLSYAQRRRGLMHACFESLLLRDHPDPAKRRGIMGGDGARTGTGAEITTYDSLDASLGPALGNTYLAVKAWATHLAVAAFGRQLGDSALDRDARELAFRASATLVASFDRERGLFPATLDEDPPSPSIVLPIVEPLVYPHVLGLADDLAPEGPFGALVSRLRTHLRNALGSGACQFEDGGWRLSSTSDNAWVSKIILAEYVGRDVLGLSEADLDSRRLSLAQAAWLRESGYWAASDQFIRGVARGSRYYPRLVTAELWRTPWSRTRGRDAPCP